MLDIGGWQVGVSDLSLSGVVVLIVMMILTDRLVTKARLDQSREETAYWRTAYQNENTKNMHLAEGARDWGIVAKAVISDEEKRQRQGSNWREEAGE